METGVREDKDNKFFEAKTANEYCERLLHFEREKLHNLVRFENYFMNDWTVSRLDSTVGTGSPVNYRKVLKDIEHNSANTRMLMAIQQLERLSRDEKSYYHPAHKTTEDILSLAQGDRTKDDSEITPIYIHLLNAIRTWRNLCISDEDYRFLYSLHTFFSIQLNIQATLDKIESLENWLLIYKDKKPGEGVDVFYAKFTQLSAMLIRGNSKEYEKTDLNAFENIVPELYKKIRTEDLENSPKEPLDFKEKITLRLIDDPNSPSPPNPRKYRWVKLKRTFGNEAPNHSVEYVGNDALLECFFSILKSKFNYKFKKGDNDKSHDILFQTKAIRRLQDFFIFLCCNWDVQSQFYENIPIVEQPTDSEKTKEWPKPHKHTSKKITGTDNKFQEDTIFSLFNLFADCLDRRCVPKGGKPAESYLVNKTRYCRNILDVLIMDFEDEFLKNLVNETDR